MMWSLEGSGLGQCVTDATATDADEGLTVGDIENVGSAYAWAGVASTVGTARAIVSKAAQERRQRSTRILRVEQTARERAPMVRVVWVVLGGSRRDSTARVHDARVGPV